MGLKNEDNNYYRIVSLSGDVESGIYSIIVKKYKDKTTRDNLTKFDKTPSDTVSLSIDSSDIESVLKNLYGKLKTHNDYDSLVDVYEEGQV